MKTREILRIKGRTASSLNCTRIEFYYNLFYFNFFVFTLHHRRLKLTLRVCYVNFLLRESVSRYKRPLRLCMRNKILRSENAKYHFISTLLTFDVFLCFLVWTHRLVGFSGCYCVTPVTLFMIRKSKKRQLCDYCTFPWLPHVRDVRK